MIPVGEAWNRAIKIGLADPNPYDGITPGHLDLWGEDHYHASVAGYYLEALMIFGAVTELDPRSLSKQERAAAELGLRPEQAVALQKVAYDELKALKKTGGRVLSNHSDPLLTCVTRCTSFRIPRNSTHNYELYG